MIGRNVEAFERKALEGRKGTLVLTYPNDRDARRQSEIGRLRCPMRDMAPVLVRCSQPGPGDGWRRGALS